MRTFIPHVRAAIVLLLLMTLLFGIIYPAAATVMAQLLFPGKATGSLIRLEGKVVGSEMLGQSFENPRYFWGRLSATRPAYNAAASGASNMSPANPALLETVNARVAALQKADPRNKQPIPVDLVTASGSGLDPHISVEAALYQVDRVATARRLKPEEVRALVDQYTQNPQFGFLGTPRVHVLKLNLALDGALPGKEKR